MPPCYFSLETTEGSFARHCKPRSLKSEYQTRRWYDESTRNVAVSPPHPSPEIDRKQPNATLCNTQSGLYNVSAKVSMRRGPGEHGSAHYRTKPNVRESTAKRAVTLLLRQVTCPSRPPMGFVQLPYEAKLLPPAKRKPCSRCFSKVYEMI